MAAVWVTVLSGGARGNPFEDYQLATQFQLPNGTDVFDALGDGRIIVLVNDNVYVETSLRSRLFSLYGTLPDATSMEFPAFIRVSPDGSKIAVGDNAGRIGVFEVVPFVGGWYNATHYDAEWIDNRHLAIAGSSANSVTVLDTLSPDPMNPMNPTIIVNKGTPGGIAFDKEGNLYTGNGFSDSGPIHTGDIKQFSSSSWMAAWTGGPVLDFIEDGTLVATLLSASSLGFDSQGNFHVGGGDFLGGGEELDSVALVRSSAVWNAIKGKVPVDAGDPTLVQRLDPDSLDDFNYYSVTTNPITRELYVQSFGQDIAYVYYDTSVVPTASNWGLINLALLTAIGGTLLMLRNQFHAVTE